jgi:polyphosphate kinase
MSLDKRYINRDVSWLSFNYRVLQEAKDKNVPLLERLKFLAIYSSNLEEFFKVRMAYYRNLMRLGKKTRHAIDRTPKDVVKELRSIVNKQQQEFSEIFKQQIKPQLEKRGIFLKTQIQLNKEQTHFIEDYFQKNMVPFVQPILLVKQSIRPFLANAALYLGVTLIENNKNKENYAVVKIPSEYLSRFIELPSSKKNQHELIMLDDIVRHNISLLFPGYKIKNSYSIKLTRDAQMYIDDEFSGDLLKKIKNQLAKRNQGATTRFVYDRDMSKELLNFLKDVFKLNKEDLFPEGRYHNNFDFFKFPSYGKNGLKDRKLPAFPKKELDKKSVLKQILKKDYLLHYPYHTYEHTIRFFEEAAEDPFVTEIKIIQYRVAKVSRIMDALIRAAKAGKKVTAFVEVKARFDEDANIRWANSLKAAGVNVLYSFPGLKVHSKLSLVIREENEKKQLFCYLSTGNFHESTAKLYSDTGLLTTDERITKEVVKVFNFLETFKKPEDGLKHLLVGQINLRASLESFIDFEIANAKAGKRAHIILKMNSIEDPQMIEKLYEASQAGVKIEMLIRGLCRLIPQKKGLSENITVYSIIDRYLEHARIFYFYHDGKEQMYLSSADFMRRNLSYRIETSFPILDQALLKEMKDFLYIQLNDNIKARIIEEQHKNEYRVDNNDIPVRSQLEIYHYLKRKENKL